MLTKNELKNLEQGQQNEYIFFLETYFLILSYGELLIQTNILSVA